MTMGAAGGSRPAPTRSRRPPPAFRRAKVRRLEHLSPRMVRVTLTGPELEGLAVKEPAASIRLLLPSSFGGEFVLPTWNGNEFLLPDGRRPVIRTLTPLHVDHEALELEVEIVVHGAGAACEWAEAARPGEPVAISGPGRGYVVDHGAGAFLVAGDETAVPAISQLLAAVPPERPVQVHIEVADQDARIALPEHPLAVVHWLETRAGCLPGDELVRAVRQDVLSEDTRVWVAGEAAAMQRLRHYLFEEQGFARSHAAVRGYWKFGRTGDAERSEVL